MNLFFTKDVQIKWQGSMDALEMHTCALQASLVLTPTSYSHHLQPSTSVVTLARSNLPLAGFGHFLAPQLPGPVAPVTVRCKTYDTHITYIGQHVRAKACATSSNQSGAESVEKCSPLVLTRVDSSDGQITWLHRTAQCHHHHELLPMLASLLTPSSTGFHYFTLALASQRNQRYKNI